MWGLVVVSVGIISALLSFQFNNLFRFNFLWFDVNCEPVVPARGSTLSLKAW